MPAPTVTRSTSTVAVILALAIALALIPAAPAGAAERSAERIAGLDRYETAAAIALDAFDPDEVDTVYLATGEGFADALAAGACAADGGAPVLLTRPDTLPDATAAAFSDEALTGGSGGEDRFSPDRVIIAGGTSAVSETVSLNFDPGVEVVRKAGANRYETAKELALDCFDADAVDTVFLATGEDFADSLAAVPAAARADAPLLLTGPDGLHPEAQEGLEAFSPDTVFLVGGPAALGEAVEDDLLIKSGKDTVERLAGRDRYATGATIATTAFPGDMFDPPETAFPGDMFDPPEKVYLATGEGFADALAGGAAAGHLDVPLLLTRSGFVPAVVRQALGTIGAADSVLLGGEAAISAEVERDLDTDLPELIYTDVSTPGSQQFWAAGLDGSDRRRISDERSGLYDINGTISPQGNQVAFARAEGLASPVGDLSATGIGNEHVERLSDFASASQCIVRPWDWSPDGGVIAWTCDPDDGAPRAGLTTLDREVTEFTAPDGVAYSSPQFLPDGDVLVVRVEEDAPPELRRLDPDTPGAAGDLVYAAEDEGRLRSMSVSPDGTRAAFARAVDPDDDDPRPATTLFVVDLATGQATELLDEGPDRHELQRWHPDGERLIVATGGYGGASAVSFVDVDSGAIEEVVTPDMLRSGFTAAVVDITPGGDTLVFTEADLDADNVANVSRVYRVNADGTAMADVGLGTLATNPRINAVAFD